MTHPVFIGADGLLTCQICGQHVETIVPYFDRRAACLCACGVYNRERDGAWRKRARNLYISLDRRNPNAQ